MLWIKDVTAASEFLLPVWMQPGKCPEGEIGSLATTLLASSKNGEKTPTDLQKYCTLLNVSENSIFHNWNHTFIFYSWWYSLLFRCDSEVHGQVIARDLGLLFCMRVWSENIPAQIYQGIPMSQQLLSFMHSQLYCNSSDCCVRLLLQSPDCMPT